MTAAPPAPEEVAAVASLPWYIRYTRWRPTSRAEAVSAEKKLLHLCKTPFDVDDVPVGPTKHHIMHTVTGGNQGGPHLVCLSGYGAGAGFFFRNLDAMAQHFRLHAVDLIGTGMSGRPPFTARDRQGTEDFFLTALAKWQEDQGLNKVILLGHSLGGYLAAQYTLQHPERVQHLVLVSPAGMVKQPEGWPGNTNYEYLKNPWSWRGQLARFFTTLWEAGATPGGFIRTLGPWGPRMVNGYARNRFKRGMQLQEDELLAFEDYFYHIMAAKGSGEHALRHLLGPFAWARQPLEGHMHQLKVPVSYIYGEYDWMDPAAGLRVCHNVEEERGKLGPADLQVESLADAGHYPFLEQPQKFITALLGQLKTYLQPGNDDTSQTQP
ncbi:hypothetical protein WJX73_005841 [Symbiochloris irregularis]|uniref:AB hydrolase-1 domain-containing protein n=1 Tax=Symbiochloris irregularis TaxID=706552 RepID=A0AAW1Q0B0_9CHLO